MTSRLAKPPRASCACASMHRRCITRLLPVQAWALYEAGLVGGLLAPIGVGGGKTALDVLAALVIPNCKTAALLIPPGLVEQFTKDYLALREHFEVPSLNLGGADGWIERGKPTVHVIPYSRFSRAEATDALERLQPDLIIADEAHALKAKTSTRTGRFLRYFAARPETRLCAWSGTITARSLNDFAHLAAFALGEGSPLPLDPDEVEKWAAAVDPSEWPSPPGALRELGISPKAGADEVRQVVSRRIVETLGVVASGGSSGVNASIRFRGRRPKVPRALDQMIADVRDTWMRPDGEEFVSALDVAKCARELACGFYYRWRFPGNPDPKAVKEWRAARGAWHKEMREKLKNPLPHLDSPLMCAKAAIRAYQDYEGDLPVWRAESWPRWRDLRDSIQHETEAVWVDDYFVQDVAAWAHSTKGIVWYEYDAFGKAVAKAAELPLHGGGAGAEERLAAEKGDRSIVVSIKSHGTGRNGLQYLFNEQYAANPPSSGDQWEQLLGRLHRVGQAADEVITHVPRQTQEMRDAVDKAIELAKYIEGITGGHQKLLAADIEY